MSFVNGAVPHVSRRQSVQKRLSSWRKSISFGGRETSGANGDATTPAENRTIFQAFEWYTPTAHSPSHWRRLTNALPHLKAIGFDTIWLPPGCKAAHRNGNGYDPYDLYDLGEFDQKGSVATKWGTKEDLMQLAEAARREGIGLIWDAVLNHKAGADGTEKVEAVKCDPKDRRKELTAPQEIEAWTQFTFPGRGNKHSSKRYTSRDFTGVDYDASTQKSAIYKFVGDRRQGWAQDVDHELGNYDYLMFTDIDHRSASVHADTLAWSNWIVSTLNLAGMRLDAMKHYSNAFQVALVHHLQQTFGRDFLIMGEYWSSSSLQLSSIIGKFKGRISLFDVQLVYNFSDFSRASSIQFPPSPTPRRTSIESSTSHKSSSKLDPSSTPQTDLRKIFDGTLLQLHPQRTLTFVANHDTQPHQSLAAPVAPWFAPHAYALILLRDAGLPVVFYGDLFGVANPKEPLPPAAGGKLPRLVAARKLYAYGRQRDYFDRADCVGWTRHGHAAHSHGAGLAVLVNASWDWRWKKMSVGGSHAGEKWTDIMGWAWGEVVIDESGWANFPVPARGVSVWTRKDAPGRDKVERVVWEKLPGSN